ncbi:MAG: TRAP transporter substrate-binding protein, partial [Polaromonas sp.]|nr:TRAP transporter substrate-binding protein [Polaromonas sp.]
MTLNLTRRNLLASAGALALPIGGAFAQAKAEFTLKYGNNLPVSHPMNMRATEMATKINAESKGR